LLKCRIYDGLSVVNMSKGNRYSIKIISCVAGKVEDFLEVFENTDVVAVLVAGILHREEVPIEAVKEHMRERGRETR
jgi:imidazole glycerol phosphate synthase subunit HisF